MLIPLKQFYCDTCHQVIEEPQDGFIRWYDTGNKYLRFGIYHSGKCLLLKDNYMAREAHLNTFINENYLMANLLSFLDIGKLHQEEYKGTEIADLREYTEIMRRLTIPYYEEARKYWEEAKNDGYFEGASEIWIYAVDNLKNLIEKYGS